MGEDGCIFAIQESSLLSLQDKGSAYSFLICLGVRVNYRAGFMSETYNSLQVILYLTQIPNHANFTQQSIPFSFKKLPFEEKKAFLKRLPHYVCAISKRRGDNSITWFSLIYRN